MDPKHVRAAMLALFTQAIAGGPSEELDDGRKVYSVRAKGGAIPFSFGMTLDSRKIIDAPQEVQGGDPPEVRDTTHAPKIGRQIKEGNELLEGVASSTSVDWYGTEMSLKALEGMKDQFNEGVSLFPRHGGWLDHVEWSDEIGRTILGIVERSDVAEPADKSEAGFKLTIHAELFTILESESGKQARDLVERLDKLDQPIGLSIGGWFLDMRFLTNEDGEIERIIVESVLLDHVAVVRSPANPDSEGLKVLRSIVRQALADAGIGRTIDPNKPGEVKPGEVADPEAFAAAQARGVVTPIPDPDGDDTEDRHVLAMQETENTVITQTLKAGRSADDVGDDETLGTVYGDDEEDDDRSSDLAGANRDHVSNPSEVTSSASLDTDLPTRDSHDETDANERSTGGTPMDPELKALLDSINGGIQALSAGQASLSERVNAIEERSASGAGDTAPAPVTTMDGGTDAEIRKLRETVEALKAKDENRTAALDNLASASKVPYQRRGQIIDPSKGVVLPTDRKSREALIKTMISRCQEDGESDELVDVVTRATVPVNGQDKSVFGLRWKARGDKAGTEGAAFRETCESGPELLRDICNAAHEDGSLLHWIRTIGPQL